MNFSLLSDVTNKIVYGVNSKWRPKCLILESAVKAYD